jgi:hypothetical protein
VRPKSIVYFEWIIFGTILLGALQNYLSWDRAIAQAASSYIITLTFVFVPFATLTLLVSRCRRRILMWVLIAFAAQHLSVITSRAIRRRATAAR